MSDIAIFGNLSNIEENHDLTRKIKRMKLSNAIISSSPLSLSSFNLRDDIQKLFPLISDEVIKETFSSSNNDREALEKLHKINSDNFSQDLNFVSIHKVNKKRRFANLEINQNNHNNARLIEDEVIDNQAVKTSMNNKEIDDFINRESEEILKVFGDSKTVDEAEYHLKNKINNYLNRSYSNKEIDQQLHNLIEDNNKLKKAILILHKKCEQNKNVNKEIEDLKVEQINLENILSVQKQNNSVIEYILKQNEN